MGGVMRPVGPESAETYWGRRAAVVGVMLVLLIAVLIFLFNLGGSPGQAAPAQTPSAVPSTAPSSSASVTPSTSPSTSAKPSARPTPAASTKPSSKTSSKASTKPSSKPSASTDPSDKDSVKPADKSSDKPADKSSTKPSADSSKKPSAKPSAPAKPAAAACTSEQLWPSLKSKKHDVGVGSKVTFEVSYINRSEETCSVKINTDSYELKIYSGSDRIWSTDDCAKLVRETATTLKPGDAVVWSMTWNGKRSAEGKSCQSRPETPGAGYYHATSKLKGAKALEYTLVLK